ncbi:unnamed protein product [Paramecium pentaurelia]|uniref:Uncharacterized protein n=1 Tax=Paramecium pentaurelia TaxID=43138 RepID=A0A8S1TNG2_9CILI|nr:unnamed protein product [Paramecium pentaurelia]CAD8214942.1 unnamed protein product [Paramecium pentaurelia]
MKQGLFILLALNPIISAFDEACAYQQCPQDYTECMQEVFGCASQEQVCHNECGETEPCFQQCVYRIGNKKFIKLYNCWQLFCKSTIIALPCNVEQCVNNFEAECLEKNNLKSFECMIGFSQQHPECKCLNQ